MAIEQQFTNFEELLSRSDLPLLVVFTSPWSGPDRIINSVLEQVNNQMQQLRIVKIDSEKYSDLSSQYQVHALPTLLLFKKGQLVERIEEEQTEGIMPAADLIQRLQPLI